MVAGNGRGGKCGQDRTPPRSQKASRKARTTDLHGCTRIRPQMGIRLRSRRFPGIRRTSRGHPDSRRPATHAVVRFALEVLAPCRSFRSSHTGPRCVVSFSAVSNVGASVLRVDLPRPRVSLHERPTTASAESYRNLTGSRVVPRALERHAQAQRGCPRRCCENQSRSSPGKCVHAPRSQSASRCSNRQP